MDYEAMEPALLEQDPQELRFYFQDLGIERFAANPVHYEYLQKAQEYLQRSGKKIIQPVSPEVGLDPIPDGVVLDPTFPADRQYLLAGSQTTPLDGFGKLAGASLSHQVKVIQGFLPAYEGAEDQFWTLPLLFFAAFEPKEAEDPQAFAFLHGQLVSLQELEPCQVYQDETMVVYNVTDLFYTDLDHYVQSILARKEAGGESYYMDYTAMQRIEAIYRYCAEHLTFRPLEELQGSLPQCTVSGWTEAHNPAKDGLQGVLTANCDLEAVRFTILSEDPNAVNTQGKALWTHTQTPEDPRRYALSQADAVDAYLRNLPPGTYSLDISVQLRGDEMSSQSVCSCLFTVE